MKIIEARQCDWGTELSWYCPGCNMTHSANVRADGGTPSWTWNGSLDKPTIMDSVRCTFGPFPAGSKHPGQTAQCHVFIKDGQIEYLDDCTHRLAGQKIDMVDMPARGFIEGQPGMWDHYE